MKSTDRGDGGQAGHLHDRRGMFAMLNGGLTPKAARDPANDGAGVVVCRDFGAATIGLIVRRAIVPRGRILLCLEQVPVNMGAVHRFVLAGVDAVLVGTDAVACALQEFGVPATRIVSAYEPGDLALFRQLGHVRRDSAAGRIIHVGDLEPEAGVAELLACLASWGDQNPGREIEVLWAGEGCLRGVLEAQPLPANVRQVFAGQVSRVELAAMFLECDMLAVPALSHSWSNVVLEALAAQLPVLGSSRSRAVAELVTHGVTGWVFDPFDGQGMARAVACALDTPPVELTEMRARAAAAFHPPLPGLDERLRRAMRMETFERPLDTASFGFAP